MSNINIMNTNTEEMEIANRNEIKTGKAQIICELENGNKEYYDIEIQRIYLNNNKDNKSMLIKIVDQRLLEKTRRNCSRYEWFSNNSKWKVHRCGHTCSCAKPYTRLCCFC